MRLPSNNIRSRIAGSLSSSFSINSRIIFNLSSGDGTVFEAVTTKAIFSQPARKLASSSTTRATETGNAIGTPSPNGESSCVAGVSCDSYTLTVNAGTWTGLRVAVSIKWTIAANDYDLYIHKDTINGPIVASSTNGAP